MSAYSDFLVSFAKNFGARVDEPGVVYPQAYQTLTKRVDIDASVIDQRFENRWYYIQNEDTFKLMGVREDYIAINPLCENVIDSGPSEGLTFLLKLVEHDLHLRIWALCGMLKKIFSASNKSMAYGLIDLANDIRQGREGDKPPSAADIDNLMKLIPAFEKLSAQTGELKHIRIRLIKRFMHEGRTRPGHAIITFPILNNIKEQLSKSSTVSAGGVTVPGEAAKIYVLLMESIFNVLRALQRVDISSEASDNFAPLGCVFFRAVSYIESNLSKVTGEKDHAGFAYTGDRKWMQSVDKLQQWKSLAGLLVTSRGEETPQKQEPAAPQPVHTAKPAPHTQATPPAPAPSYQQPQPPSQEAVKTSMAAQTPGIYQVRQPVQAHTVGAPGMYTVPQVAHHQQLVPPQNVQPQSAYTVQNFNGHLWLCQNNQPVMQYNQQQHAHLLAQPAQMAYVNPLQQQQHMLPCYTLTQVNGVTFAVDAMGNMAQYNPQVHVNIVQQHHQQVMPNQVAQNYNIVQTANGPVAVYADGSIRPIQQTQQLMGVQQVNAHVSLGASQVATQQPSLGLGVPLG
ncbi:MAG: hypothetical protein ACKO0Z_07625 [Betaproteobacteria bacterium]